MLQPLQLEDVSQRYPEEIAEVRSFLGSAGVAVGSQQALAETAARLREDRGFRRDLTSYLWAALHQADGAMSSAQLLGVVAIAAAGTAFAAEAGEADAHELLRFVMEARRSFGGASASAIAQQRPIPLGLKPAASYGPPMAGLKPSPFKFEENSLSSLAAVEEQPDRRKLYAAIGAAACLLLVLLIGLSWHRNSGAAPAPASTAAVVPPAAPVAAPPVVAPAAELPAARPAPVPRRAGREHAVRPGPAAKAAVRAPASQPAAAAPVTRAAAPRAPVVAASRPASAPSAPPVPTDGLGPEDTEAIRLLRRPGDPKYTPDVARTIQGPFVHATSLGIMASHVTYGPAPAYPKAAADAHVQGEVKVEAEVSRDGDVTSARVISGPPLLRDAATAAVQQWKYRPYIADGNKPVAVNATVLMDFQLP
jgi:TonB family protein